MTTHPPSHPDCYTSQQGRQPCACPAITPASLALPTRRVYTCAELGVCQHRATPCAGCHTPTYTPATALHQANSDGTHRDDATPRHTLDDITPTPLPWDWIDDLKDFVALAPIAAALCGMASLSLGALVGWVLKG